MFKRIVVIMIGLIILSLICSGCTIKNSSNYNEKIIHKEEAIKIAKKYVFNKYKKYFRGYIIDAMLKNDMWIVIYMKGRYIADGGGPSLRIKKIGGEVIGCHLQK